jgi:hypothetical protein
LSFVSQSDSAAILIAGVAISFTVFTQSANADLLGQQDRLIAQLTSIFQLSDVASSGYYFG